MTSPSFLPDQQEDWQAPIASNEIVRRTYNLLTLNMALTALTAAFGMDMAFPYQHPILLMLLAFGVLFVILWTGAKSSPVALPLVFVFSALIGLSLGPLIAMTLQLANGATIVTEAAFGTVLIFGGLSLYAAFSKRDFSFLGGFLFVGLIIVVLAGIANLFLNIPALELTVAAASLLVFVGYTLFDTSRLLRGGETNPVLITVSLYLDVLNIFVSLLDLLSFLQGRRR